MESYEIVRGNACVVASSICAFAQTNADAADASPRLSIEQSLVSLR